MQLQSESKASLSAYRWIIVSLLFFATMINYFDRLVLSVLIPEIQKSIDINEIQYGQITAVFQFAYCFGALAVGKFIDWLGAKTGYLFSIIAWSMAAIMHSTAGSATAFGIWRGMLGASESGNFPAAMKAVSEWFPKEERSLATSLFNSGPAVSMIIGAPIIYFVTEATNWRMSFVAMGGIGLMLAALWPFVYRNPPKSMKELDYAPSGTKVRWRDILRFKATYGILLGKSLTDPVWWFYLNWYPTYLNTERGFNLGNIAIALPLTYTISIIMGNLGGWFPGFLIKRGSSSTRARKIAMGFAALCMPFTVFAVTADNAWIAISLVSLACGAHCIFSHNILTMITDQYPMNAVGSATGLSTFAGSMAGVFISSLAVGYIVTFFGYAPIFILMGILHPMAFMCVHLLVRKNSVLEEDKMMKA